MKIISNTTVRTCVRSNISSTGRVPSILWLPSIINYIHNALREIFDISRKSSRIINPVLSFNSRFVWTLHTFSSWREWRQHYYADASSSCGSLYSRFVCVSRMINRHPPSIHTSYNSDMRVSAAHLHTMLCSRS